LTWYIEAERSNGKVGGETRKETIEWKDRKRDQRKRDQRKRKKKKRIVSVNLVNRIVSVPPFPQEKLLMTL